MGVEMLRDCLVSRPMNAQVAGTTQLQGSVVDMASAPGFDAVMFILQLNSVASGGVTTQLEAMEVATNSNTGGTRVPGASATHTDAGSGADSNGVLIVDVARPKQRYIYPQVTRAGGNVQIDSIIAIQYRSHGPVPEVQGAGVLATAFGTAEI